MSELILVSRWERAKGHYGGLLYLMGLQSGIPAVLVIDIFSKERMPTSGRRNCNHLGHSRAQTINGKSGSKGSSQQRAEGRVAVCCGRGLCIVKFIVFDVATSILSFVCFESCRNVHILY
jgi:hypothetical protein